MQNSQNFLQKIRRFRPPTIPTKSISSSRRQALLLPCASSSSRNFRFPLARQCGDLRSQKGPPTCWQCNKQLPARMEVHCPNCGQIQPIHEEADYFSYFGITPHFELNPAELKQRFKRKQATVHPDKFTQSSEMEQKLSADHSTFLNNAYRTLRDPYSRADYMLELLGKQSISASPEDSTLTDPELAEQMMELNEQIEAMQSRQQVEAKMGEVDAEIQRLFGILREQLAQRDVAAGKKTMQRIGYFRRSRRLLEAKIHGNKH